MDIDSATLRRLYVDEGLSTREIGERYGTSRKTIWRRLVAYGLSRPDLPKRASLFVIGEDYDDELQRVLRYVNAQIAGGRSRDDVEHLTESARTHLRQSGRAEQRVA